MNAIAGWFVMIGLMIAGSSIGDIAKAIEKNNTCQKQTESMK